MLIEYNGYKDSEYKVYGSRRDHLMKELEDADKEFRNNDSKT